MRDLPLLCSAILGVTCAAGLADVAQAATEAATSSSVQEVIVTATRRSERLVDVPLSVTAVTAQTLVATGVTQSTELPLVTPGLRMDAVGTFFEPAIRGITTTADTAGSEPNVATYVDGAYMQLMQQGFFELPDVESVQVLKGPQGTLFGRNATGGAILINTLNPDLEKVVGHATLTYGSLQESWAKAYLSVPVVTDKLAVSGTAYWNHARGYKHDLLQNGKRTAGWDDYLLRGKVRFIPWTGADFVLTGSYSHRNDQSPYAESMYNGINQGRVTNPGGIIADKPWTFASTVWPTYDNTRHTNVTLHGDIDLGPGKFSTMTHYDRNTINQLVSLDFSTANFGSFLNPAYSRNLEQEFLYTTNQLGRFKAVGGVFLYDLKAENQLNVLNHAVDIYNADRVKSVAAFGEGTYDITDQLALTAGARVTRDTASGSAATVFGTAVKPPFTYLGKKSWTSFTPRASVLYKLTPRTNVYFTYSQGFKSGVFNSSGAQTTPVNPEKVRSFEAGVKSEEFDRVTLSAAGFYYDYKDLQVTSIAQGPNNSLIQTQNNAAKARIYGAEFNATWRLTDDFDLTAGATWLHARYTRFPHAAANTPVFVPSNPVTGVVGGFAGAVAGEIDASGNTMIRSPTFSGDLIAHYKHETQAGTFDASAVAFYSTKVFFDFNNYTVQKSYALINSTVAWQPRDSAFKFSAWVKNLTNKAAITTTISSEIYESVDYTPPRQFGVTVDYNF